MISLLISNSNFVTTGETNSSKYKLFGLMGEAYGSGLPLGFLLIISHGGASGGLE